MCENRNQNETQPFFTSERRSFLWGAGLALVVAIVVFQFLVFRSDIHNLRQEQEKSAEKYATKSDLEEKLKPLCTKIDALKKQTEKQAVEQEKIIQDLKEKVKNLCENKKCG